MGHGVDREEGVRGAGEDPCLRQGTACRLPKCEGHNGAPSPYGAGKGTGTWTVLTVGYSTLPAVAQYTMPTMLQMRAARATTTTEPESPLNHRLLNTSESVRLPRRRLAHAGEQQRTMLLLYHVGRGMGGEGVCS